MPTRAVSRPKRIRALLIGALAACATLPYLNILANGFVYDDDKQLLQNPYVQSFRYLKEIFTSNVWSFRGTHAVTNYYRPMMTLGYLICYKLFGMRAWGFHLVSLLIHVVIVCFVFLLTERLTGDRVWAFAAGALFALHPVHTESVAWIAAVTDLELTFFFILTFGFFLALAKPGGGRSIRLMTAMGVAFVLALLSKEQAMTLPALATVYEHFYREDRSETSITQKLGRYGVLWLVGAVYMLLRMHFFGAVAPIEHLARLTPEGIVLSAFALVGQYVGKFLWPMRLCAFYVFQASKSPFEPGVLAGLLVLFALAALFLLCWRSRDRNVRFASFGIVWFFATLAPVLNAHWLAANVFTERYLYLPSIGLGWLAGLGASKLWSRAAAHPNQRQGLALAGLVLAGLYSARIVNRDRDWSDDIVLYNRTLDLSPDAVQILNDLGTVYWHRGFTDKAESAWQKVLAMHPDDTSALNNLGLVAGRKKNYSEAAEYFQRAMKLRPQEPDPHRNMGTMYRLIGMPGPAEAELRKALELAPLDYLNLNELGRLLLAEGRVSDAEAQFRASVRYQPNALAYDYLGEIDIGRHATADAQRDFRAALSVDQSDSNAHFGLGFLAKAAGRRDEALREYLAGLAKDPNNPQALAAVQELR